MIYYSYSWFFVSSVGQHPNWTSTRRKRTQFLPFFFLLLFFPFLNSRASSTCLGKSQQNQFSSSICND